MRCRWPLGAAALVLLLVGACGGSSETPGACLGQWTVEVSAHTDEAHSNPCVMTVTSGGISATYDFAVSTAHLGALVCTATLGPAPTSCGGASDPRPGSVGFSFFLSFDGPQAAAFDEYFGFSPGPNNYQGVVVTATCARASGNGSAASICNGPQ
jgi:hypothetical protein